MSFDTPMVKCNECDQLISSTSFPRLCNSCLKRRNIRKQSQEKTNRERRMDEVFQSKLKQYDVKGRKSEKSWMVLFLLWLLGGYVGLHRYYAGRWISGFFYTITIGFLFLGWAFDLLLILFDSFTDSKGLRIRGTIKRKRYRKHNY